MGLDGMDAFLRHGPLLRALGASRWLLLPHAIKTEPANGGTVSVSENVFQLPDGGGLLAVVVARNGTGEDEVRVELSPDAVQAAGVVGEATVETLQKGRNETWTPVAAVSPGKGGAATIVQLRIKSGIAMVRLTSKKTANEPYPYPKVVDAPWPGGGFPRIPWAPNWDMREAMGTFFVGNTTGANSAQETQAEASLGIAGLGWQLSIRRPDDPANVMRPDGHLEEKQAVEVKKIKAARKGVRVLVDGDMDCTGAFWNVSRRAMENESLANELFVHWPNGSIFYDEWGTIPSPWFNYSSPLAVKWWITEGPIAQAMKNPDVDGVYLDGADIGIRHGRPVSVYDKKVFRSYDEQSKYLADQRVALEQLVLHWRKEQPTKWITGYAVSRACFSHGGVTCAFHCPRGSCAGTSQLAPAPGKTRNPLCAETMRELIARQAWANQTTVMQTAPLATFSCTNWSSPNPCVLKGTTDPKPYVGAFLVARGPSALLQLEPVQPPMLLDYYRQFESLRVEPGLPLGDAREVADGVFERNFTTMRVSFACEKLETKFFVV